MFEATTQPFKGHLQVHLIYHVDDQVTRDRVVTHAQYGVLLSEPVQRGGEFLVGARDPR